MVTINPQDAKPDEVYEGTVNGERWTMRRAFPEAEHYRWHMSKVRPGLTGIYSRKVGDSDVSFLVRLVPAREVTRDDLPDARSLSRVYLNADGDVEYGFHAALDAVVAHLNANGGVPASREDAALADRLERQAATIGELQGSFLRVERAADRWRRAHSIVEQERDQAREQWKKWEYKANEWRTRAEAAEARTAPAVTRREVQNVVGAHDPGDDELAVCRVNRLTDAVCDLFGIEAEPADPVEQKAETLFVRIVGEPWSSISESHRDEYRAAVRDIIGQETDHA